jgi:hypothetical protein
LAGETSEKNTGLFPSKCGITVAVLEGGGTAALEPGATATADDVGCTGEEDPAEFGTLAEDAPGTSVGPATLFGPTTIPPSDAELTSPIPGSTGAKPLSLEESPQADKTKLKPNPHNATPETIFFISIPILSDYLLHTNPIQGLSIYRSASQRPLFLFTRCKRIEHLTTRKKAEQDVPICYYWCKFFVAKLQENL